MKPHPAKIIGMTRRYTVGQGFTPYRPVFLYHRLSGYEKCNVATHTAKETLLSDELERYGHEDFPAEHFTMPNLPYPISNYILGEWEVFA